MNRKTYNQIRAAVTVFISFIVALSVTRDSYILAIVGTLTGMLFLIFVRTKTKITVDEREITVREKAARLTYAIFAPTIGLGSLLLLMPSKSGLSVFSKGEFAYIESLGTVLAYLTLFMIAIYALSYHFINRKYGGSSDEE
jgi:uncharacterized membrane protein